jgi:hypothetical protein
MRSACSTSPPPTRSAACPIKQCRRSGRASSLVSASPTIRARVATSRSAACRRTLNNYTLNGVEIGNPDGTTRSLPLDIMSGQLLNRIEIAKVKTADMDGQGVGGTDQPRHPDRVRFQQAHQFRDFGQRQGRLSATQRQKVPYQVDLPASRRASAADDQFGIALGGKLFGSQFQFSEGFYPDNWTPVTMRASLAAVCRTISNIPNIQLDRQSDSVRADRSTGGPATSRAFYVRGVYSKFTENEMRARYRLDFSTRTRYTRSGHRPLPCELPPQRRDVPRPARSPPGTEAARGPYASITSAKVAR